MLLEAYRPTPAPTPGPGYCLLSPPPPHAVASPLPSFPRVPPTGCSCVSWNFTRGLGLPRGDSDRAQHGKQVSLRAWRSRALEAASLPDAQGLSLALGLPRILSLSAAESLPCEALTHTAPRAHSPLPTTLGLHSRHVSGPVTPSYPAALS